MNYLSAVDFCFLDLPSGAPRVAWDVAGLMRDRGHVAAMVCIDRSADARPGESSCREHDGIRVVRYSKPVLPGWHPARAERTFQAAAAATRRWLGNERWDIVHFHTPLTGHGVLRTLGSGPRYIATVHSPMVAEQVINWKQGGWVGRLKLMFGLGSIRKMEGDLLRPCAGLHTLSQFTRDEVQRYHGLGDRVTVVPYWRRPEFVRQHTKSEAREKLGWPADRPILLTVRHHGPRYGIDVAIRAIGPLTANNRCLFVVGGDGPWRPSFEQISRDLRVTEGVRFTGRLSDEHLRLAYEAADLFILPTLELECFGLIILEALSFGCPVLSSDSSAIPETMRPILPDFIVPAGDVQALREKVADFLDGRLVAPTPDELVQHVAERYSVERVSPRLIALLEGAPAPSPIGVR